MGIIREIIATIFVAIACACACIADFIAVKE